MLNTFENAGRQHLRRKERERHLRRMEEFAKSLDFMDDPDACAVADALSGNPLRKVSEDQMKDHGRSGMSKRAKGILALSMLVALTLIGFLLGLDRGEQEYMHQHDTTDTRRKTISSLILDWGITSPERLGDLSSPAARAMEWLVYTDLETTGAETIRTRFALATLFFATQSPAKGNKWIDDRHWLSSYPVCLWYGVDCLDDRETIGLVKSLNLSSNALTGTIPEEIGLLGLDIRSLDLGGNKLVGTIPETVFLMKNLGM